MSAVTAIASAPPMTTRNAARPSGAPPRYAAEAPRAPRGSRATAAAMAGMRHAVGRDEERERSARARTSRSSPPRSTRPAAVARACPGRCPARRAGARRAGRGRSAARRPSSRAPGRGRASRRSSRARRARPGARPSSSRFSSSMSACSASRCELTDTYSPAAIDIAPATRPATPAIRMAVFDADDAATPIIRLAVDTMASLDPSTAARSQPARPLRWISPCNLDMGGGRLAHVTPEGRPGRLPPACLRCGCRNGGSSGRRSPRGAASRRPRGRSPRSRSSSCAAREACRDTAP